MSSITYFILSTISHLDFHNTIKLYLTVSLLVSRWFTLNFYELETILIEHPSYILSIPT